MSNLGTVFALRMVALCLAMQEEEGLLLEEGEEVERCHREDYHHREYRQSLQEMEVRLEEEDFHRLVEESRQDFLYRQQCPHPVQDYEHHKYLEVF